MKTFIAAALLIATAVLLAAPALAQASLNEAAPNSMDIEMERRKKANAEAERGYKNMLKQTSPGKETKTDPWGNARAPSPEKK